MTMTYFQLLAGALLLALPWGARAQTTVTLPWKGLNRTYTVYVPSGYAPSGPALPLVLACHPGLSNAGRFAQSSRWHEKGETEKFITVYPNGTARNSTTVLAWNAYNTEAPGYGNPTQDDAGFLNAVLTQVQKSYKVDATRVYMTGFSMGAWMTFRMGCDFTERFAALGPVSGSWKYGYDGRCDQPAGCNGSPIPGTNPVALGASVNCEPTRRLPLMTLRGSLESVLTDRAVTDPAIPAFWAGANQCQPTPVRDVFVRNGETIERAVYPACAQQAEVVQLTVVGNGHQWHRAATDELWDFFKRFRRVAPTGPGASTGVRVPPVALSAAAVYPNPAAGPAGVRFVLARAAALAVEVRTSTGQVVGTVPAAPRPAGSQELALPTEKLPNGLYLVRLCPADGPSQTLRLSLQR